MQLVVFANFDDGDAQVTPQPRSRYVLWRHPRQALGAPRSDDHGQAPTTTTVATAHDEAGPSNTRAVAKRPAKPSEVVSRADDLGVT